MTIDDGQRSLARDQQQLIWSHVQTSHPHLFEKLLKQYSEKKYITKEKKVSLLIIFRCILVR
jgi:hypothetical protein